MHNSKIIYLLFLLWVISSNLTAATYSFRNISTAEGLSHRTINCMLQDSKGFVWIGTSDGLNRFDGYAFKQYFLDNEDSLSLGTNVVTGLTEDLTGTIWLSTGNGIYNYLPATESFYKINFPDNKIIRQAEGVCVDNEGTIWGVENSNTILKMSSGSTQGKYVHLDSLLGIHEALFNKKIFWADGFIWIFNKKGIVRYDYINEKASLVPQSVSFKGARRLRRGKSGEVLVVDWGKGVYRLNTSTLKMNSFITPESISDSKDIIGITDVCYMNDGSVWITGFPGLFKVMQDGTIVKFNRSTGYELNYDKKVYFSIMSDNNNNIWLGSQDEGLFVISKQEGLSRHYKFLNDNFLEQPAVRFLIDKENLLFCNLDGTFISTEKENWEKGITTPITDLLSFSVAKYNESEYVIFTKNDVLTYNMQTKQTETLFKTSDLQNGIVDSRGIIWVTHWEQGLEGYDPKSGKKYQIDVDTIDKSSNVVFSLFEDSDGSLWLGTFGSGLQHIIDPTATNPKRIIYKYQDNKNSISNNFILSLHKDAMENIWIGTNGGGLNKFNIQNETFDCITTTDGLRSNVVQSVTSDLEGNIWFATSNITKYSIKTGKLSHYGINDGIKSKYFNLCAQTNSEGIVYFADNKGVLALDPQKQIEKRVPPKPLITNVRLFGKPVGTRQEFNSIVPFPKSVTYSNSIELPYNINSISLEFASVEPSEQINLQYRYILEGINSQWITTSAINERSANYAGLATGNYTFRVQASTGKNNWSSERILHITITPPWWKSFWVRVITSLIVAIVIAMTILTRFKRLNRRNKLLEQKVADRTRELVQKNERMKEQQIVIEMKNNQLNEALSSKDQLISILAHDFKNPLNGILGVSELLNNEIINVKNEKIRKYITIITHSANSLINQMMKVLDWVQNQDEKIEAKPVEINIEVLLDDILLLEMSNAIKKGIQISTEFEYLHNAYVDPRMINMVFRNLLTNAMKFTPKGGNITIEIEEKEEYIETKFINSGKGITEEKINQILHTNEPIISQLGTVHEKGIGLGLRLCNTFIEKNSGRLNISNDTKKGAIFSVSLPKGKSIANKIEKEKVNIPTFDSPILTDAKKLTILLIDDDPELIEIIDDVLNEEYEVIKAEEGDHGLRLAKETIPDIIISDVNLPSVSGIEICSLLRKNPLTEHIPILLISSHSEESVKNSAFKMGATDYIEKPFKPDFLKKKVDAILSFKQNLLKNNRENPNIILPDNFEDKTIQKVIEYINKNISEENLNSNTIADSVGLSRSQLWRILKQKTGKSLSDLIREIKLQTAASMLMSGKYRVSEVSDFVGFANPRYFSRIFYKEFNISPSEYANNFKKS